MWRMTAVVLLVLGSSAGTTVNKEDPLEESARQYLDARNAQETLMANTASTASWNYGSNLTDANRQIMMDVEKKVAEQSRELWRQFVEGGWPGKWRNLKDFDLRRQFNFMSRQGDSALTPDKLAKYQGLKTDMATTYGKAKVHLCVNLDGETKCELSLEPELTQLMGSKRDYDLLKDGWILWRDASGKVVRNQFIQYVELSNEAARLNNFTDGGDSWRDAYESPNFSADMAASWENLRPLYQQMHAYVRRKLRNEYGEEHVSMKGPIPAHLTGNMWAQSWVEIFDLVMPYPEKPALDVTGALKQQGYTPLKMFQLSNKFFKELNLTEMSPSFWTKSIMEKPKNTELLCHASAWDFYKDRDFRIKMCSEVTMTDLVTIHHEMGHVEYYEQYKHQPFLYRNGANPGFHEAVGDSLALSVQTPKHLQKIGLLNQTDNDPEADINFLMKMALSKVVFLPFGYLIDMYRWDVFSGKIPSDKLNCEWWKMRYELQGLKPPVKRSEEDFDPGAKYHVVDSVPYIRYFFSYIVQFQFHKTMCEKAGQYEANNPALPLHRCDIDQSTAAGNVLASMLKMGGSRPWTDALEQFTGSRSLEVSALLEYFKPLEDWLKTENNKHGEFIGWEKDGDYCG